MTYAQKPISLVHSLNLPVKACFPDKGLKGWLRPADQLILVNGIKDNSLQHRLKNLRLEDGDTMSDLQCKTILTPWRAMETHA